ncbi:uncharacterized protein LOC105702615 [Orussus abietinus]|uniref:uncharacterized protein LOC105702602 n=1 Tax=Orussus abietinus TaxID=222816 RepID=UPI0006257A8A|nr:uncharacterized protein LOC105702602 [Orussus abietinus]XP_012285731.1 uncharacterized protein LOC105702615 [Orussus abietinus]
MEAVKIAMKNTDSSQKDSENVKCTRNESGSTDIQEEDLKSDIQKKLSMTSCPYTWGMEKLLTDNVFEWEDTDREEILSEIMGIMMMLLKANVYDNKKKIDDALEEIQKAEDVFKLLLGSIPDDQKYLLNVLRHIIFSTKGHVLYGAKQFKEAQIALKETYVHNVLNLTDKELGSLYGCQAIAWSLFRINTGQKTLELVKRAIEKDNKNAHWYFFLGKTLRRLRRFNLYRTFPSNEEMEAFGKAFSLSQCPTMGIYYAQSKAESKQQFEARSIYTQIFNLEQKSFKVQLRLALGFIRLRMSTEAKQCLNLAGRENPENVTYLHYMGMYLDLCCKKSKEALDYYKLAGERGNSASYWSYMSCMRKLNKNYNPREDLCKMLDKCEEDDNVLKQKLLLHIAECYEYMDRDMNQAAEYYLKAVTIDPKGAILNEHSSILNCTHLNAWNSIEHNVLRRLADKNSILYKELMNFCRRRKEYEKLPFTKELQNIAL